MTVINRSATVPTNWWENGGNNKVSQIFGNLGIPVPGAQAGVFGLGTGAGGGVLPGAPGVGGSAAAGQRPQVPDPTSTQSDALAGNLANLARLRQLFNQTSDIAGVTPQMTAAETSNINSLLHPPSQFVDIDRMSAEAGTATGVAGSAAANTRGYRMTDEERLRRQLLGSQLLGQRVARGNAILPLQQQMQTGTDRQIWQNHANTIAAGADPEQAFQRALELAREGLNRGFSTGYGQGAGYGAPGTPPPGTGTGFNRFAPYAGPTGTPSPADNPQPTVPGGWGVAYGGPGTATAGQVPNFAMPDSFNPNTWADWEDEMYG